MAIVVGLGLVIAGQGLAVATQIGWAQVGADIDGAAANDSSGSAVSL